jgi:hypothetical protein
LEVLREIPDRRRAEGKRFDLATVLLYTILGMVAAGLFSSQYWVASVMSDATSSAAQ